MAARQRVLSTELSLIPFAFLNHSRPSFRSCQPRRNCPFFPSQSFSRWFEEYYFDRCIVADGVSRWKGFAVEIVEWTLLGSKVSWVIFLYVIFDTMLLPWYNRNSDIFRDILVDETWYYYDQYYWNNLKIILDTTTKITLYLFVDNRSNRSLTNLRSTFLVLVLEFR